MKKDVSIIIPLYNEKKRVGNLRGVYRFLQRFPHRAEVIVINDGSTDGTFRLLRSAQKIYGFRIISYRDNRGKGYALRQGVKKSRGTYILMMDIDISVPITFLTRFWRVRKTADIIIATRRHRASKILMHQSVTREVCGRAFSAISCRLLGISVSDVTCGFKLFTRVSAKTIFAHAMIDRFAYDAEVLYLASQFGYVIAEEPVIWKNDRRSTVVFPRDFVASFIDLLRVRYHHTLG